MQPQPKPLELHAEHVWLRPGHGPSRANMEIAISGAAIAAVEPAATPSAQGRGRFVMPALVNAHDHARGLRHLAFGARDEPFETWRGALYAQPRIDPYTNAAYAFARMALSGIGTTLCVYSSIRTDRLVDDAAEIARAARDVGIRIGFVVPIRNQSTMALGDDLDLLAMHEAADRETIKGTWLHDWPSAERYVDIVRSIGGAIESPLASVQYGPNSPHACSEDLREKIAEVSQEDGRRIHCHFLESVPQREWADANYPNGLLPHLADIGWLSNRFTAAHGIWLDDRDCALMGGNGVTVAINTTSNLRVFSGLSPVSRYLAHGVGFGFGMDSFSLDDDDDMFHELKLSYWLHSPVHHQPRLSLAKFYDQALATGYRIVMNEPGYGAIEVGARADLVSLDYAAMSRDIIDGMIEPADVVLTRATSRYVRDLWVAGRQVVRDRRLTGVDFDALEQEVFAQARAQADRMRQFKPILRRHQQTLAEYYASGGHRQAYPQQKLF